MRIIDLDAGDSTAIQQTASLMVEGFREHAPLAWPDLDSALEEIHSLLKPGNINRIAVDEAGNVLGWIGGQSEYDGHVWQLHPLVVFPQHQGKGIGRALVADLEEHVRQRGGITIYLGTDDEDNQTSLANVDLYPNVAGHILTIQNLNRHPYEFYQKAGYVIVGLLPDANGFGKPDIWMAKRVGRI